MAPDVTVETPVYLVDLPIFPVRPSARIGPRTDAATPGLGDGGQVAPGARLTQMPEHSLTPRRTTRSSAPSNAPA